MLLAQVDEEASISSLVDTEVEEPEAATSSVTSQSSNSMFDRNFEGFNESFDFNAQRSPPVKLKDSR